MDERAWEEGRLQPVLWTTFLTPPESGTHLLAAGVYFSGFVKDLLCLPRPLSPPLQRITMSGSAALEYGFPSTHSTNAVSVAFYCIYMLNQDSENLSHNVKLALQGFAYFYASSLVLGRLYCGMHGFLDVIWGSILGAGLAAVQCIYGQQYDDWFHTSSLKELFLVVLIVLVLVRIHPEPVDDCPCYEDSVAFAGVVIGIEIGSWHFSGTDFSLSQPYHATVPFDFAAMGWIVTIARVLLGVVTVFAWRAIMKPTLLRILPPIFRVVERYGMTLPRRFFIQASQYQKVPSQSHGDNIIPAVSQIPSMLTSLRRRRAVSIGPQSEADAYETMAYREKVRRDSLSSLQHPRHKSNDSNGDLGKGAPTRTHSSGVQKYSRTSHVPEQAIDNQQSEKMVPESATDDGSSSSSVKATPHHSAGQESPEDGDVWKSITKPRVRYDVEVVTKLVVYSGQYHNLTFSSTSLTVAGIGWLATEGCPILFELVGLGSR